jgi:hypothetical protein
MAKKKDPTDKFRDRIKELRRVSASELMSNEKNWRRHPEQQRTMLRSTLENIGIADAMIAREDKDGSLVLIDGHLRKDVVGDQEFPVLVLDVDENEADLLLASIDPLASMAIPDDTQLEALLRKIHNESGAEIQDLISDIGGLYNIELDFEDMPLPPGKGDDDGDPYYAVQVIVQLPKHKYTDQIKDRIKAIADEVDAKFMVRGVGN